MKTPFEQLEANVGKIEHQLIYHLLLQQMETNRLLGILVQDKQTEAVNINGLKRNELMGLMRNTEDAPQGWSRWSNDKIKDYLKGV